MHGWTACRWLEHGGERSWAALACHAQQCHSCTYRSLLRILLGVFTELLDLQGGQGVACMGKAVPVPLLLLTTKQHGATPTKQSRIVQCELPSCSPFPAQTAVGHMGGHLMAANLTH